MGSLSKHEIPEIDVMPIEANDHLLSKKRPLRDFLHKQCEERRNNENPAFLDVAHAVFRHLQPKSKRGHGLPIIGHDIAGLDQGFARFRNPILRSQSIPKAPNFIVMAGYRHVNGKQISGLGRLSSCAELSLELKSNHAN